MARSWFRSWGLLYRVQGCGLGCRVQDWALRYTDATSGGNGGRCLLASDATEAALFHGLRNASKGPRLRFQRLLFDTSTRPGQGAVALTHKPCSRCIEGKEATWATLLPFASFPSLALYHSPQLLNNERRQPCLRALPPLPPSLPCLHPLWTVVSVSSALPRAAQRIKMAEVENPFASLNSFT